MATIYINGIKEYITILPIRNHANTIQRRSAQYEHRILTGKEKNVPFSYENDYINIPNRNDKEYK
jgi:hypothetical protein